MSDHDDIRKLLAEYCFATDTGDAPRYGAVFAENGRWEGGFFGRFDGRAGAVDFLSNGSGDPKNYRHVSTNAIITVAGDAATALSYIQVYDQSGQSPALMFSGVYEDMLVKVDGAWLFDLRTLRTHPSEVGTTAA